MKKKNRLMVIKYQCTEDIIERLQTCLDMCCIKYVIFKECDFTDGDSLYIIYIDKNKCTWKQVMTEVNRVKSVKFNYVSDSYIDDNGRLCTDLGTLFMEG